MSSTRTQEAVSPSVNSAMLRDGTVVRISGTEFRVSQIVACGKNGMGQEVWKFTGHVADPNDSLHKTMYNGGRYSYRISDNNIVSQPNH